MGGLTLDLRPGAGLGAFNLGMPVCEALAYVEQHRAVFDVVHVKYNDEEPLKVDLVISFPEHGFHLRFEPRSQRLRLIEVFDVQRLQMRYATSSIGYFCGCVCPLWANFSWDLQHKALYLHLILPCEYLLHLRSISLL
jgi:hypothetical protein